MATAPNESVCGNCGGRFPRDAAGASTCAEPGCRVDLCPGCAVSGEPTYCAVHAKRPCAVCGKPVLASEPAECPRCAAPVCEAHFVAAHGRCVEHAPAACGLCRRPLEERVQRGATCGIDDGCGKPVCAECARLGYATCRRHLPPGPRRPRRIEVAGLASAHVSEVARRLRDAGRPLPLPGGSLVRPGRVDVRATGGDLAPTRILLRTSWLGRAEVRVVPALNAKLFTSPGFLERPLGREGLLALLQRERGGRPRTRILLLASPTGFAKEALAEARTGTAFRSETLDYGLVDLASNELITREAFPQLLRAALTGASLAPEADEVRELVEARFERYGRTVLLASEVAADAGHPLSSVLGAFERLARTGRYVVIGAGGKDPLLRRV